MNTGINEKTLKIIKDIIGKYNVEKRVIFGSRARGNYRYNSDIDIAIFGTINRNDFNRLLDELMESDCIYKIDLVHFERISNEELKKDILEEGIEF
ncbi:MAG: nucleotidyltransferase domain-containing protein [Fusobacteriaceae bacterium]|nr:nucleotidyltransferase domain-containing protein [Fusobacteriaceae bacterium]MBN2838050.1 nucleotidyltransferase domain-containing protein [Fusobacteriaceae bacterium]